MSDQPLVPVGEVILYQTEDGRSRVECRFADETLWLSQALIAELFQVSVPTVNEHLSNIYAEGELSADPTIRKFRIVRQEGTREVSREIEHYNLDAILAVGYRVRSERGTQFRQWATERLKEYLVKGFTMDDERLKNPPVAGSGVPDYFDELLERIRDVRASEKRMYLRVREIFALAGDYDAARPKTLVFFQTIQNKLHFAATGKTAAELIAARADHTKPNMNLTSWKGDVVESGRDDRQELLECGRKGRSRHKTARRAVCLTERREKRSSGEMLGQCYPEERVLNNFVFGDHQCLSVQSSAGSLQVLSSAPWLVQSSRDGRA